MGTTGELSNPVRDLLLGPIDSMDQVQILAVLASDPRRAWTSDEIAGATRLPSAPVMTLLRQLASAELVGQTLEGDEERFTNGASTATARGAVAELLDMYNTRPVTLVRAIYSGISRRPPTFEEFQPDGRER